MRVCEQLYYILFITTPKLCNLCIEVVYRTHHSCSHWIFKIKAVGMAFYFVYTALCLHRNSQQWINLALCTGMATWLNFLPCWLCFLHHVKFLSNLTSPPGTDGWVPAAYLGWAELRKNQVCRYVDFRTPVKDILFYLFKVSLYKIPCNLITLVFSFASGG